MPFIEYKRINFRKDTLDLIELINSIVREYGSQGYDLTLRQVYYQLVARGYIPNNERSYKNLGNVINDGRLAGMIDWDSITDRTRNLRRNSHWDSPRSIIDSAYFGYQIDRWKGQPNYVEVWVEKDALVDVVGKVCNALDVPYFSCRGYVSQSEMWTAAQRFINRGKDHKREHCTIIHLGDHDPSGIDMSRDIQDRLDMFEASVEVRRIALNMEQVEKYSPPPNPTKLSDARSDGYIRKYGYECWELDALEPKVLDALIRSNISPLVDSQLMRIREDREHKEKEQLRFTSRYWSKVVELVTQLDEDGEEYDPESIVD